MGAFCCHLPILYQGLPKLHAFISIIELLCGILRIIFYFSPLPKDSSQQLVNGQTISQEYTSEYVAAFTIDWISSIVQTLMGIFVAFIIIGLIQKILSICSQNGSQRSSTSADNTARFNVLWKNKCLRRFISLDCNCPCYKARPRLRFLVRFVVLVIFFILRIIAISMYLSVDSNYTRAGSIASLTAITLACLFAVFLLDVYHYCVWWHYTPYLDTTCCCCHSRKHVRYLPYLLVGAYRDNTNWGDRTCMKNPCLNRRLEHIATFHSSVYQPQERWTDLFKPKPPFDSNEKPKSDSTYIGFHTTTPEAAVNIAKTNFIPSRRGMLGPGMYFARSLAATIGKIHVIPSMKMII
jgi:hypothetical protein